MVPHAGKPPTRLKDSRSFFERLLAVTHVKRTAKGHHIKRMASLTGRLPSTFVPAHVSKLLGTLDTVGAHGVIRLDRCHFQAARSQHQGQVSNARTDITKLVVLLHAGDRKHRVDGYIRVIRTLQISICQCRVIPFGLHATFRPFNRFNKSSAKTATGRPGKNSTTQSAVSGSSIRKSSPATWVSSPASKRR